MTTEEALKILDTIPTISEQVDALELAIKALEQQPCEDCISREDVLAMKRLFIDEDGVMAYAVPTGNILRLPSVTPTRPTGKWEYVQYDYNPNIGNWHCSECRFMFVMSGVPEYKYCPNCGARMEESEGDECR